jgi:hypothetical protein
MANGNDNNKEKLYNLLPAIYRERDIDLGEPLRALIEIIQQQSNLVEADIRQLWDDFFIETCEPWVIPYIGDLVGTIPLFDASRTRQPDTARRLFPDLTGPRLIPEVGLRNRADVARTIYYRRRKGTLPMLEELARDVTGWGAHAVEFFQLLGWTQFVRNHLRHHSLRTPDIRRVEPLDRLNGPFDEISHTADVRAINPLTGWYNIKNIGFFLWRLQSYEMENVAARRVGAAGDFRYHISPLGSPAPLFTRWRREGDEAGLATELHVPGPIRAAAFYEDLKRYHDPLAPHPGYTDYYGLFDIVPGSPAMLPCPDCSFVIFSDGIPIPPDKIRCMDLSTWKQPVGQVVGVDVKLGRLAFGTTFVPAQGVDVYYHYGFSSNLGGGSYQRRAWNMRRSFAPAPDPFRIEVDQSGVTPGSVVSINDALNLWVAGGKQNTIISILDNRTYAEAIQIEPRDDRWLVIEAADGQRPHLQLTGLLEVIGNHPTSSVTLSGLLIEGAVHVIGSLGRLRILHSTLVPGRRLSDATGFPTTAHPSITVDPGPSTSLLNKLLRVEIAFSITGPLRIPAHVNGLWVLDSIIDGVNNPAPSGPRVPAISGPGGSTVGPESWLERVTIFGSVRVKQLVMASEVIFADGVIAERKQEGCVRFSFVPQNSVTPQRYRCQPDLEIATQIEKAEMASGVKLTPAQKAAISAQVRPWLVPTFTATVYGNPAYAQLHLHCPEQIQTGAEDGSEMGAFCHLKQPQRESNLRLRLEEYLPFGLEPGIIYVT